MESLMIRIRRRIAAVISFKVSCFYDAHGNDESDACLVEDRACDDRGGRF